MCLRAPASVFLSEIQSERCFASVRLVPLAFQSDALHLPPLAGREVAFLPSSASPQVTGTFTPQPPIAYSSRNCRRKGHKRGLQLFPRPGSATAGPHVRNRNIGALRFVDSNQPRFESRPTAAGAELCASVFLFPCCFRREYSPSGCALKWDLLLRTGESH